MAEDDDRLATFVRGFQASFGSRAMDVAVAQLESAKGEAMLAWQQIVDCLNAEEDPLQPN